MKKFPQFLKTNPTLHGLQFSDIAVLMVVLYIGMLSNLNSLTTLLLSVVAIGVTKILRRYLDFTGIFVPRKKEIFLTDIKRGKK